MAKIPKSVRLKWPVGPHYLRWVDGKGVHAWARYKLKSADWYLDALNAAAHAAGDVDRYVGIEMALDGALSSLCAAVDAAGSALWAAVAPVSDQGASDWESVIAAARAIGVTLSCEQSVLAAIAGAETRAPTGWLAQLRQLTGRAVQHNVLVRRFSVGGDPGRFVDVPGLGPRRPIEYLRSVRGEAARIVEEILADIDALERDRSSTSALAQSSGIGARALPDLSARARIVRQR